MIDFGPFAVTADACLCAFTQVWVDGVMQIVPNHVHPGCSVHDRPGETLVAEVEEYLRGLG